MNLKENNNSALVSVFVVRYFSSSNSIPKLDILILSDSIEKSSPNEIKHNKFITLYTLYVLKNPHINQ